MFNFIQDLSNERFIIFATIIALALLIKLKKYACQFLRKVILNELLLKNRKSTKYRVRKVLITSFIIVFLATGVSGCDSSQETNTSPAGEEQLQNNNSSNEQKETNGTELAAGIANEGVHGEIKVHFIDVGQADAILIQQGNHVMMVDSGNNEDGKVVKNYLENQGIKYLDFLVGTHPHEDHIGGLDYIINSFKVGKIYMPKLTSNTNTFSDVVTATQNKGLKFTTPVLGESFKLGDATCTIVAPNSSTYENLNNYSIVIKVSFGGTSFLLTGDAEDVAENEIIIKDYDIASTVLKIGHHGSDSSTTTRFLNKVNPKYAIISVGKDNSYGHPKQSILDRLKAKGIVVYRTDENGSIIATSDGAKVTFNTEPGTYKGFANSNEKNDESAYNRGITSEETSTIDGTTPPSVSPQPSKIVYWTPNGKSYHYDKNCSTLSRSKVINQGELSTTAKSDPCDVCVN
jgi:competence protein ComEC